MVRLVNAARPSRPLRTARSDPTRRNRPGGNLRRYRKGGHLLGTPGYQARRTRRIAGRRVARSGVVKS
ncbi:hypothetical protein Pen02_19520 [Plantactinospora endophytica]|uniref:50S ribosomal protein L34 n=1 Tax=Plantactinospora endophytica TaxID=673535 RepID=A0ABQ4DY58_9ACTN|nr:hypothetical protein Pen02_19520 [Plantactinospora endophytica]